MAIRIKYEAENPIAKDRDYKLINQQDNVEYKGFKFEKRYSFEKKLNFLHRFALGFLALLGKISIYFRDHKKVIKWMKHAREGKIEKTVLVAKKSLPPQKELDVSHKNPVKEKDNETYSKRIEDFKKFCSQNKIDIVKRRKVFYQFFTDENLIKSPQITNNYDFGVEDVCGVFFIDSKNEKDKKFLNYLYEKYPDELKIIHQSNLTKGFLTLTENTRFANNDTFMFICTYQNQPKVLTMLKDVLLYGILRNQVCNER